MKRILALLMALILTCGCLAGVALAAEGSEEQDTARLGVIVEDGEIRYRLLEEDAAVDIESDAVPLSAPPHMCCALHFVLMLGALAVAVYFTHDRKLRQARIYEMRLAAIK